MTCDVQPEVPRTSLTTTYIPPAVAKAQFSQGWNLCFDEAGFLSSLHTTSLDGSFTILRWHGRGIDLYGNVTTHANYTIKIDGADIPTSKVTQLPDSVLASFTDLPCANHTLVLTLHVPEDDDTHSLTFDKAVITQHASYASSIPDSLWTAHTERGKISTESTPPDDSAQRSIIVMTSPPIEDLPSEDRHATSLHTIASSASRIGVGAQHPTDQNEEPLFVSWKLLHDRSIYEGKAIAPLNTAIRRSTNGGTPSGTIAAIVLGASLVLGLVAWLIFYFRVYRPRVLSRPSVLPTTSPFASPSENPAVASNGSPPVVLHELPVIDISNHNRYTNTSDTERWKRIARGNEALSGDLVFRHSNVQEERDLPHTHGTTDTSSSHHRTSRWFGSDTQSLDVLPDETARQRRSPVSWGSSAKSYISRTASSINLGGTPTRPAHGRTSSSRPLLQEAAAAGQSFDDVEDVISLMDHPLTQPDSGERLGLADSSAALRALSSSRTGAGLPRRLYDLPPRLTDVEVPVQSPVIDVPASSPFRVDFAYSEEPPSPVNPKPKRRQIPSGVASALGHSESRHASTTSHVRFDINEKEHSIHESLPSDIAEDWAVASRLQAGPSSFHLTPPPTPYDASFLDLSSEESGSRSRPSSGQSEAHSEARSSRSARITNETSHASRILPRRLSRQPRPSLPSLDIEVSEDQMHQHPELEDFSPTTTMSSVRFSNGTMLHFAHGTQPPQMHPDPPLSMPPAALKRF